MILPPMILPTVCKVQPKKWQNHKWQNHGGRDGAARRCGLWFWLRRFVGYAIFVANGFTLLIQRARQAVIESYICAMSGSVDFLTLEAMDLPPDQRLTLAHRILSSVEPTASPEIDAAWDTEIRNRIARYDTEGAHSLPAVEVFAELDRRLRR